MKQIKTAGFLLFLLVGTAWLGSCKKEENSQTSDTIPTPANPTKIKGTSDVLFNAYVPLADKPIRIFYHIPASSTSLTPILFVFHGTDRDARYSRDAMIANADKLGFIVIAPEFSDQYYPGADSYNLGNVFVDGDNPTSTTLNLESNWTFSIIEPIFEFMKEKIGSSRVSFDVFGHSAGGQFVHRLLLFKPLAKVDRYATAASGWYTMFDNSITFPYGTKMTPMELVSYKNLFNKNVFVLIGDQDTNPNSSDLRHNDIVDKQGLNRLDRAIYFYTQSRAEANKIGSPFNWKFQPIKGVGHEFAATSSTAALLLYP